MGRRRPPELVGFRQDLYSCLTRWGDTLFELTDAALCASGAISSVPSLSLEPEFSRSHGSLYKALAKGRIDEERLRDLLVAQRPKDWPLVFALDTSTWERCDAECSPERGFYYSASKHSAGQPIVAGWSFSWIAQLCFAPNSWTAPLDVERISPLQDTTSSTIGQIRRLLRRLPDDEAVPLFVFDAGYDPIALAEGLAHDRAQILCRIREDRVFYADPPARPNRPASSGGRPPRHGRRMKCSDKRTWPKPSDRLVTSDPRYGTVTVSAWHHMHPRLSGRGRWKDRSAPPIVRGSVIRVEVEHLPKHTVRNKKTLWLFWAGPGTPDLDLAWRAYLRRFDIEHTFRFAKNTLGWTSPSLCTPEQAERWSWLVVAMLTQLRLARDHVDDLRLPWERPRQAHELTPARVRRGFRRLRAHLGTPASPPKHTKAGPGRPKGTRSPPRTRYPAIKRAA
jgi:DDE superfamily endonuclease